MRRQWQGERGSFWKNHMTEHILHSSTKLKQLEGNVFKMWLSHILRQMYLSEGEVSRLCSLCWRLSYFTNWPFCAMQRGSACECRSLQAARWASMGSASFRGGFKKDSVEGLSELTMKHTGPHLGNDKGGQMENSDSGWVEGSSSHY